jgi:hypothetical protein
MLPASRPACLGQQHARVNLRRLDGVPIGYAVYFFLYSTWLEHGII